MERLFFEEGIAKLKMLRQTSHLPMHEKMNLFIDVLADYPESIEILKKLDLIDPDLLRQAQIGSLNRFGIMMEMKEQISIETEKSADLAIAVYGYNKTITPGNLNELIDRSMIMLQTYAEIDHQLQKYEKQWQQPEQFHEQIERYVGELY